MRLNLSSAKRGLEPSSFCASMAEMRASDEPTIATERA
jgi:hypothetical protein